MRVTDDENCHNRWNLTQIPTDAYCQDNKKDTSTVAPNVPKKLNIPDKDIPDDIWLQCNPYAACTMQIPFLCGFVQAQATVRNGINYPTVPAPATLETVLLLSFYTISLTGWLFTRSVCSRLCGRIKVFVKHTHNSISRLFSLLIICLNLVFQLMRTYEIMFAVILMHIIWINRITKHSKHYFQLNEIYWSSQLSSQQNKPDWSHK